MGASDQQTAAKSRLYGFLWVPILRLKKCNQSYPPLSMVGREEVWGRRDRIQNGRGDLGEFGPSFCGYEGLWLSSFRALLSYRPSFCVSEQ